MAATPKTVERGARSTKASTAKLGDAGKRKEKAASPAASRNTATEPGKRRAKATSEQKASATGAKGRKTEAAGASRGVASAARGKARGKSRWTINQRTLVFGSFAPVPGDPGLQTPDEAWATLQNVWGRPSPPPLPSGADRAFDRRLQALRDQLASPEPPALGAPEDEVLRWLLLKSERESAPLDDSLEPGIIEALVGLWVAQGGLAATVDIFYTKIPHTSQAGGNRMQFRCYRAREPQPPGAQGLALMHEERWWLPLRRAFFHSSEAERRAGLKRARTPHREVFSCDPARVNEAAEAALAKGKLRGDRVVYFAGLTDASLALRLAKAIPRDDFIYGVGQVAYTIVDNLGRAAAPVLRGLAKRIHGGSQQARRLMAAARFAEGL